MTITKIGKISHIGDIIRIRWTSGVYQSVHKSLFAPHKFKLVPGKWFEAVVDYSPAHKIIGFKNIVGMRSPVYTQKERKEFWSLVMKGK